MVHAGDPSVLVFVIGRVRDLASSCSKLFEISLFVMNYTLLPVPKLRTFENFGKKQALLPALIDKRHCLILQLHFKFKKHQIKDGNWFLQQLLWSFFFWSGDYRTLPVPAQNCLNYCFSQLVALDYVSQRQENLKNLARSKLLHPPYLIRGIAGSYFSTSNLKFFKWKTDIGSCRSSFGPSLSNWKVTGPYSFLLKIIWNTAFPN